MRSLVTLAPALLLVLAGCLEDRPPGEAGAAAAEPCEAGDRVLFLRATDGGGFVPPEWLPTYTSIDRNHSLFRFEGTAREGTGLVKAEPGALHNLTEDDVRAELERLDAYRDDRDYTVTKAFRDTVDRADFAAFCGLVTGSFHSLDRHYDNPGCADGSTLDITVSTEQGVHTSSAYCGAGPEAFHDVRRGLRDLVDESARRTGAVEEP